MGYTCFEIEESEGVAHVILSRPDELNTMIPAFWSELPEIIDEMSDSGRVRCVVISSTGKHFSAGMDLSVFTGGDVLTEGSDGASGGDSNEVGRQRANLRTNAMHLQRHSRRWRRPACPSWWRSRVVRSVAPSTW